MTCLKKLLCEWLIYPLYCFSTLDAIVSLNLYVKHLPFASWIRKSLTNCGIPYTMKSFILSACIEYPAAILESRNFSLNLSDTLCQLIETTGCFQIYVKLELFLLWVLTAASSFGVVGAIERLLCYWFDYNQVLSDFSTHSRFSDISLIFHAAWLFLYRFVLLKNPADILYKTLYNYRCWPQSTNFSHSSATLDILLSFLNFLYLI